MFLVYVYLCAPIFKKMRLILIGVLAWISFKHHIYGQDRLEYIDRYKDIAMYEMARTGIPASIKLAQAILESDGGKSELARKSNNHFGIKCGGSWNGKKTMRKDDDRNAHGKLVKSCFRAFDTPEESFIAHSDFLLGADKSSRYRFLFDLDPGDYKAWAHGLKKAGYATNPKYPKLLIRLIEQYELQQYDLPEPELMALADPGKQPDMADETSEDPSYMSARQFRTVRYNNDVQYVLAAKGDRVADIAHATETAVWRILRYNEKLHAEDQEIEAGTRVYLQKKRRKFRGTQEFHIVRDGQDMFNIAQMYAIRLDKLYDRNAMESSDQPAKGAKIRIRGVRREKPALRIAKQDKAAPPPQDEIFLPPVTSEPVAEGVKSETRGKQDLEMSLVNANYIVQKGDTLYQISRMHGIHIDDLRKMNNLAGDTIHPGQKIKLSE